MRLLFINETHPATQHVAGMRLHYFAKALARRGHEVLHLTGAPPGVPRPGEEPICDQLAAHDWSRPFVLPVFPFEPGACPTKNLPPLLRRARTAWNFLRHGGPFPLWSGDAQRTAEGAISLFQPDLIWATFGNSSTLEAAQRIARKIGCPWVIDIKDNWQKFCPAGLRRITALRFRDAVGMTTNSRFHEAIALQSFPKMRRSVVHSGVADSFYAARARTAPANEDRLLLLVGGTYDAATLAAYIAVVDSWVKQLPTAERKRFHFRYLGSDDAAVQSAIDKTGLADCSTIGGYAPLDSFAGLAAAAVCCSYLWAPNTFHHKLLELLVAARSVIVFPGEHNESRRFAEQAGTPFQVCASQATLHKALSASWAKDDRTSTATPAPAWRWDDFAVGLEQFFLDLLGNRLTAEQVK